MATTTTTSKAFSPSTPHAIYNQIKTYPFSTDLEFQSGLRAILSKHSLTSSEIRTRTLQAQCFYISRCATTPVPPLPPLSHHSCIPGEKLCQFNLSRYFFSKRILSPLEERGGELLGKHRKNNVIPLVDVEAYVNWLRQSEEEGCVPSEKEKEEEVEDEEGESGGKGGGGGGDDVKSLSATSTTTRTEEPPPPYTSPPPYPQSFSHLVELITTGQTIPGIKEVPNTLLTGQGSKAVESKRSKPWEVHREVEMETDLGEGEMKKNDAGGAGDVVR